MNEYFSGEEDERKEKWRKYNRLRRGRERERENGTLWYRVRASVEISVT